MLDILFLLYPLTAGVYDLIDGFKHPFMAAVFDPFVTRIAK